MKVGTRTIGGDRCFVIAEAGVNHNGDLSLAEQLVHAAADAGADAVKFQTFSADELVTAAAPKAPYQAAATDGGSQREMLRTLELDAQAHSRLQMVCRERDIIFLSSAFSPEAVGMLVELKVDALKIASGELTNPALLAAAGRSGIPVILSTGMADLDEVAAAVEVLRASGASEIALLHCVSTYPASPDDANLRAMGTLRAAFEVPVGFSDHTTGTTVPVAAAALGAAIIEKHLTLDRDLIGPDHAMSLEPGAFAEMVAAIREVETALGDGRKMPRPSEAPIAAVVRRSIVAARDLAAGTVIGEDDVALRRPGTGLPPSMLENVVGRRVAAGVSAGEMIREEDLA